MIRRTLLWGFLIIFLPFSFMKGFQYGYRKMEQSLREDAWKYEIMFVAALAEAMDNFPQGNKGSVPVVASIVERQYLIEQEQRRRENKAELARLKKFQCPHRGKPSGYQICYYTLK